VVVVLVAAGRCALVASRTAGNRLKQLLGRLHSAVVGGDVRQAAVRRRLRTAPAASRPGFSLALLGRPGRRRRAPRKGEGDGGGSRHEPQRGSRRQRRQARRPEAQGERGGKTTRTGPSGPGALTRGSRR